MELTHTELEEMKRLKERINENPASVSPESQERFTELYVRSLHNLHSKGSIYSDLISKQKHMDNIDQHIEKDRNILNDPTVSPQSRRHTEEELESLERYKENHPDSSYDPTPLELYCDSNPSSPECRLYDN